MKEASRKLKRKTSKAISSAISLQASEAGQEPCNSQELVQPRLFGLEAVPVNPTPTPGSGKATTTNGTYGLRSSNSSASADLKRYGVSRLRQRFDSDGSMEYVQTWKEKITPAGMPYWEHTASRHRTSDNDFTGWPTATQTDAIKRGNVSPRPGMMGLSETVALTGWATPSSLDWKDTPGMAETGTNPDGSLRVRLDQLPRQAALAGWHTPDTAPDAPNRGTNCKNVIAGLGNQASGVISTSSPAETGKRGVLNPVFVAWLMGYPEEWLSCVDWGTR